MHGEMEEYNTVKENLQSAADALGIENASLKEVREAIKEKYVPLYLAINFDN